MALGIKVTGYVGDRCVLNVEPRWWDADTLTKDPRFTGSNDTGSYPDWDADLTVEELRELHERYRPKASSGIYGFPEWQRRIAPDVAAIDSVLAGEKGELSGFHVLVFTWDSGL